MNKANKLLKYAATALAAVLMSASVTMTVMPNSLAKDTSATEVMPQSTVIIN